LIAILNRQQFALAFEGQFTIAAYPIVNADPAALLTLPENIDLLRPFKPQWFVAKNLEGVPLAWLKTKLRQRLLDEGAVEFQIPVIGEDAMAAFRKSQMTMARFIDRSSGQLWQHRGEIATLRDRAGEEFRRIGVFGERED